MHYGGQRKSPVLKPLIPLSSPLIRRNVSASGAPSIRSLEEHKASQQKTKDWFARMRTSPVSSVERNAVDTNRVSSFCENSAILFQGSCETAVSFLRNQTFAPLSPVRRAPEERLLRARHRNKRNWSKRKKCSTLVVEKKTVGTIRVCSRWKISLRHVYNDY